MPTTLSVPIVEYKPGCYLLHFLKPLGDASRPGAFVRHYCGSSKNVGFRLMQHEKGVGYGKLVRVANERGIIWCVARIWPAGDGREARVIEKRLKANGHFDRLCPFCQYEKLEKLSHVQE